MHLSLPLLNFTQWEDKCASYSFTTKKLTHIMCQVSLVVKYIYHFSISADKSFILYHNFSFTNIPYPTVVDVSTNISYEDCQLHCVVQCIAFTYNDTSLSCSSVKISERGYYHIDYDIEQTNDMVTNGTRNGSHGTYNYYHSKHISHGTYITIIKVFIYLMVLITIITVCIYITVLITIITVFIYLTVLITIITVFMYLTVLITIISVRGSFGKFLAWHHNSTMR